MFLLLPFLSWELMRVCYPFSLSDIYLTYAPMLTVHCGCLALKSIEPVEHGMALICLQKKEKKKKDAWRWCLQHFQQIRFGYASMIDGWTEKEQPQWAEQLRATGNEIKTVLVFVLKLVSVLDFERCQACIRSSINGSNQEVSNSNYLHVEEKQLDSLTSEPQKRRKPQHILLSCLHGSSEVIFLKD